MKSLVYVVIVVVVVIAGYFLWAMPKGSDQGDIEQTVTSDEISEKVFEEDMSEASLEVVPEPPPAAIDYTGTHIMPDGSVMTGRGLILTDAIVTTDGMIRLSDGTELVPTADMRPESER